MTQTGGYTHVLLDLGNVVYRIHFDRCWDSWAKTLGAKTVQIQSAFSFDAPYCRMERGEIDGHEYHVHLRKTLARVLELELDGKSAGQFTYEEFLGGWNQILGDPIRETLKFIESNPDLRFSLLSNTNPLHAAQIDRLTAGLACFEKVFYSFELGARKPEARAFERVLRQLGTQASQVVFVDDLLENVRGAQTLGIRSVLFDQTERAIEELGSLTKPKDPLAF